MSNFPFFVRDEKTEKSYEINGFDPKYSDSILSYTSNRVIEPHFNKFKAASDGIDISTYVSSWDQYDGRLDNDFTNANCGRGSDIKKLLKNAEYDTLYYSFFAVTGDRGDKASVVAAQAKLLQITDLDVIVPDDAWGALASYRNVDFDKYKNENYPVLYHASEAQGLLGGLVKVTKKPSLLKSFSISVGGWTLSEPFGRLARDPSAVERFAASVGDFCKRFPSVRGIDIDWEFPAAPGGPGTNPQDDDPEYFSALLQRIRINVPGNVRLGIAVSADPAKIKKGKIGELLIKQVDYINLMAYDLFTLTTGEDLPLAHDSNLYPTQNSIFDVDTAVQTLLNEGVDPKKIRLGYPAYARLAKNASITSFDPLEGSYSHDGTTVLGSFESAVLGYSDLLANYLAIDDTTGKFIGKNDYELHFDSKAKAHYLYSPTTKVYISFESAAALKIKAEYVREKGLGGMFCWTGQDEMGLLYNAVRMGLGHYTTDQVIDMSKLVEI